VSHVFYRKFKHVQYPGIKYVVVCWCPLQWSYNMDVFINMWRGTWCSFITSCWTRFWAMLACVLMWTIFMTVTYTKVQMFYFQF